MTAGVLGGDSSLCCETVRDGRPHADHHFRGWKCQATSTISPSEAEGPCVPLLAADQGRRGQVMWVRAAASVQINDPRPPNRSLGARKNGVVPAGGRGRTEGPGTQASGQISPRNRFSQRRGCPLPSPHLRGGPGAAGAGGAGPLPGRSVLPPLRGAKGPRGGAVRQVPGGGAAHQSHLGGRP